MNTPHVHLTGRKLHHRPFKQTFASPIVDGYKQGFRDGVADAPRPRTKWSKHHRADVRAAYYDGHRDGKASLSIALEQARQTYGI